VRKISFVAALLSLCASALHAAQGGGGTSTPLPPSAVLFSNTTYHFNASNNTFSAPVSVGVDGAWLSGKATWSTNGYLFGWDCHHSYTGTLSPNVNDYSPLFIAGWTGTEVCSDQPPAYGCINCGIEWGGVGAAQYMTTNNYPGFIAAGTGTVTLSTNNGGGQDDQITIYLNQVNRDAMVNMTIFQSLDPDDPTPASSTEVQSRYFIANTADRVPIVPVFHYGVDSNGADLQFPAGPAITYVATWDTGQTSTPEIAFAPMTKAIHGHTILAVPIPKMALGNHTFTIKATLPSGKTYTSPSMTVFVYPQVVYLTYGTSFDPKNPTDDLPRFVPGQDVSGNNVDLRTGPQTVQLNVIIPKGSSGTFNIHLDPTHYPGIAMNYPISNPDTNPDIDFGGLSTDQNNIPIPHGGGTKVYSVPLQIHDYAGSATVEVTMPYRKTTFTARRHIPLDDDNNGLPDAGWNTPNGHVNTAGMSATDDLDATPSGPTQNGDGFSAYEEYRGFIVQGQYERLDPQTRDVFIDADSSINRSFIDAHLPYRLHSIIPGESLGTDLPRGTATIARTAPVMDPNRKDATAGGVGTTVPGSQADGQRAIRLVYTSAGYPTRLDPNDGNYYPVWQFGIYGITWQDQMSIEPFDDSQAVHYATLTMNKIRFVEIVARSQTNGTVHMGGGANQNPPPVYLDDAGQPVPDCQNPNTPAGVPCDRYLNNIGAVLYETLPQGNPTPQRFILHSRLTFGGDYYSKLSHPSCGVTNYVEVSQSDYAFLWGAVVAHETGHNLTLDHTANCGELMFGSGGLMPDFLPYPTNYTATELGAMRTHQ